MRGIDFVFFRNCSITSCSLVSLTLERSGEASSNAWSIYYLPPQYRCTVSYRVNWSGKQLKSAGDQIQ